MLIGVERSRRTTDFAAKTWQFGIPNNHIRQLGSNVFNNAFCELGHSATRGMLWILGSK